MFGRVGEFGHGRQVEHAAQLESADRYIDQITHVVDEVLQRRTGRNLQPRERGMAELALDGVERALQFEAGTLEALLARVGVGVGQLLERDLDMA